MSTFHVDSEVGPLRQVILHRPGLELSRLTPRNVDALLFDDILWAKRAREEHEHGCRQQQPGWAGHGVAVAAPDRQAASSSSCRPNISACSSGSAWS